jgi:hypothetical protein
MRSIRGCEGRFEAGCISERPHGVRWFPVQCIGLTFSKATHMWMDEKVVITEPDNQARWFRLLFDFKPNQPATTIDAVAEEEPTAPSMPNFPSFLIPNRMEFTDAGPTVRLEPVGKCVYCGAFEFTPGSGRKLSEEHIVTHGLGGMLVLPEASCESCQVKTKKIEGSVLRTLLWVPRRRLKIRGKSRKREEKLYPVTAVVDGRDVVMHLPLEEHPALLFLMVLNAPGILCGRPIGGSGIQGAWAQELGRGAIEKTLTRGVLKFTSPAIDTVRFA